MSTFQKTFMERLYNDNTQLFAVNTEDCPTTIEYEYYLSNLPDEFEMVEHDSLSFYVYTLYENTSSGQVITFSQYTKEKFTPHYNTEHNNFEEIEINDQQGIFIDFSNNEHIGSIVVWDHGDYILEIIGDLPKNNLVNLAESAKVLEN